MKKRLWLWLLVLLMALSLFYSCQNVAKNFSNSEILYRSKCSSCHNLIEPSRFDKETWYLHIEKYGQKMTDEEKRVLLDYLTGSEIKGMDGKIRSKDTIPQGNDPCPPKDKEH